MATIKSYTDLEQSHKLAEILPLESADMAYWKRSYRPNDYAIMTHHTKELQEGFEAKGMEYVPCWSLSALLNVLGEDYSLGNRKGKYYVCMTHINHDVSKFDNPIDACVDMIVKLKESDIL